MAYVLPNNTLYLHIPKTGGNWLTDVLRKIHLIKGSISHKHADLSFAATMRPTSAPNKWVQEKWVRFRYLEEPFNTICVVRHPLSWYSSWYRYQVGRNWPRWGESANWSNWHIWAELNHLCQNPPKSYDEYVERLLRYSPGYCSRMFGRYSSGKDGVVFKQEVLATQAKEFFSGSTWGLSQLQLAHFDGQPIGTSPLIMTPLRNDLRNELLKFDATALALYGYDACTD